MKISRIYTVAAYQPIGEWIAARMFSRGERMWMTDEDVANAGCWFVLIHIISASVNSCRWYRCLL